MLIKSLPVLLSLLAVAACDSISGKSTEISFLDGAFSVQKPATWVTMNDLNDSADLQMGNDLKEAYAIIISESKMDFDEISLEEHSKLTRSFLREGLDKYTESDGEKIQVGDINGVSFRLTASVDGVKIVYLHVTLESASHFHQMLLWSLPSKYSGNEADFKSVVQSFKALG